jgi:hypothetical protein
MTSNNTEAPKVNIIPLAIRQRFHMIVPLILTDEQGNELNLPMVVMTSGEEAQCETNAYLDTLKMFNNKVPKKDEPSKWDQVLDAHRAAWITFTTIRHPNDLTKKFFLEKQQVFDSYSYDELDTIMLHYTTVRMNQPILKQIDPTDPNGYQKLLDIIKRDGEQADFFLSGLTTHTANQLIKSLAKEREQLILQLNNGSSGKQ